MHNSHWFNRFDQLLSPMIATIVLLFLLCSSGFSFSANSYSVQQCKQSLAKAHLFVEQAKTKIVAKESERQKQRVEELVKQNAFTAFGFGTLGKAENSEFFCPAPAHSGSAMTTNTAAGMLTPLINGAQKFLSNPKGACEGPQFRNITTITDQQFGAFVSKLAVEHALPLCSICDRMLSKAESIVLAPSDEKLSATDVIIRQFILAHLPSVESVCSLLLPYCSVDYQTKAATVTAAAKCAECTICRAITTVLVDRILLNQTVIQNMFRWINGNFINPVCAEVCRMFPPNFFFPGISYPECTKAANRFISGTTAHVAFNLMPDKFCVENLHWCKPNEAPSIIHCLKEFCDEALPQPWQYYICNLLPDDQTK